MSNKIINSNSEGVSVSIFLLLLLLLLGRSSFIEKIKKQKKTTGGFLNIFGDGCGSR